MQARSTILNELREISPTVAAISPENTYLVPQGYFEGLAATIMARIKADQLSPEEELETLSPLLKGLGKKLPFEVPQGYFTELSETVVGGVKAIDFVKGEVQHISPLLETLRHNNVYEVPAGYFDSLAGNILNKVKGRQPAKVVSMGRKVMRYAVAAMVAGVMAIGAWWYFSPEKGNQIVASVEKISDDSGVSEEEMAKYLENETLTAAITPAVENEELDMDAADVKEMLSDVSDDELQQYLTTL